MNKTRSESEDNDNVMESAYDITNYRANIKVAFYKYLNSLSQFKSAYERIFLISFFENMDMGGWAKLISVAKTYRDLYAQWKNKGLLKEYTTHPSILNFESSSLTNVIFEIMATPFNAVNEKGFISSKNRNGVLYAILNENLFKQLGKNGIEDIKKFINSNLMQLEKIESKQNQVKGSVKRALTPFEKLKKRIEKQFPLKKFISDILINEEEFDILVKYFLMKYRMLTNIGSHKLIDPMFACAIVQLGVKYYAAGNFWGRIANGVGIDRINANQQTWIRETFNDTLRKYEKLTIQGDDTINNILMHCFVADYYANDFFEFLFAFYRIDLERDIEQNDTVAMNSLIETMLRDDNTGRSYFLVKHTADAIRANTRGCKIRIRRFLRLIDKCFWERIDLFGSSHRLTGLLNSWKDTSKNFEIFTNEYNVGGQAVGGKRSFSSPYIRCDFKASHFELVLPSQLINYEYNNNVHWDVTVNDRHHILINDLYQEAVTGKKTETKILEINSEELFGEINIKLLCDDRRIKTFKIQKDCIRFFDKTGSNLRTDALPCGEVYSFTNAYDQVISKALIDSETKGSLLMSYFSFQTGDIVRLPDGKPVSIGKRLEEGLTQRGIVPNATVLENEKNIPIYQNEPVVFIKIPKNRVSGTVVKLNNSIYKMFDKETLELKFTKIDLNGRSGDIGYVLDLKDYNCKVNGIYSVIIDVPNDRTNRAWDFVLIKGMEYEFEDSPYIFKNKGTISFSNSINIKEIHQSYTKVPYENKYNFIILPEKKCLSCSMDVGEELLRVDFEMPVLNWKFDDGNWEIEKPSELWYRDFPTKISFIYPEDSIRLSTDDRIEYDDKDETYVDYVKLKEKGFFECDVTRFKSWFNRDYLKQTIYFENSSSCIPFLDVITRSQVVSNIIRGDFNNNFIIGEFDIIGQANYYADIEYDGVKISEKVSLKNGAFKVQSKLSSGEYKISLYEDEEDDTGFGEENYLLLGEYFCDLINPNNLEGKSLYIQNIKKGEGSRFYLPLKYNYRVENLMPLDDGFHLYTGNMIVEDNYGKIINTSLIEMEFYDLNKIRFAYVTFRSYGENLEFLYDNVNQAIVKEEKKGLPPAVKYRRYEPMYPEEYVYLVSFISNSNTKNEGYGMKRSANKRVRRIKI